VVCPHRGQHAWSCIGGHAGVLAYSGTAPGMEPSESDSGRGANAMSDPMCPGDMRAGPGAFPSRAQAPWELTALTGGSRCAATGHTPPAEGTCSHQNKAASTAKKLKNSWSYKDKVVWIVG